MNPAERKNHSPHPMTAAEARGEILGALREGVKPEVAQARFGKLAGFAKRGIGRLSDDAVRVYENYAETGEIK